MSRKWPPWRGKIEKKLEEAVRRMAAPHQLKADSSIAQRMEDASAVRRMAVSHQLDTDSSTATRMEEASAANMGGCKTRVVRTNAG